MEGVDADPGDQLSRINKVQTLPARKPTSTNQEGDSIWKSTSTQQVSQLTTPKVPLTQLYTGYPLSELHRYESWHSRVDQYDARRIFQLEEEDNARGNKNGGTGQDAKTVVSFSRNDPECAYNWSKKKKNIVRTVYIIAVLNSTFGSALPSGAISFIGEYFHVTSELQLVLPISMFLVGYVLGPLVFSPLSEQYGRKKIMVGSFTCFTAFTLGCALAPNWPALLVFRFLAGINASTPISVVGGLFADLYSDPTERGKTMAYFMLATTVGPPVAPIVSGFVSVVSWRWAFWIGFIFACVTFVPLVFMPETYGPIILKYRAQRLRKETGNPNIFAPIELEGTGTKQLLLVTLSRPIRMFFFEALTLFTCLYLALAYAIFYLFFEAYPLIFQGIYGMSAGVSGLAFLPILLGACFSTAIFLYYNSILTKAKKARKPWAEIEEYRRLPLACIAGPLWTVGLFWLGWTSRASIHWIVPMLAGIPLGCAFLLLFMALINYLTDAYSIFAASANAAASTCRSIFGALLPLATKAMYRKLGIPWASSLLALVTLLMSVIPFIFIKYGDRIRANSQFCQYLEQQRKEIEEGEEAERSSNSNLQTGDMEKRSVRSNEDEVDVGRGQIKEVKQED
ncbi:MAG: hypothetical protein M1834_007463 [Cirrosporium novae-zelandiae]|nr:MAG: hypothetical protein M1834_007463 [Cirrosporium novae-zelandiae]